MLTIYGNRLSRAARCLWALEELGLPYAQVPLDFRLGETKSDEYQALSAAGKVPILVDGDFTLSESVAINRYLSGLKPTHLLPDDLKTRARVDQWSCWALSELEFHLTVMVRELRRSGGPDAAVISACLDAAQATLQTLEKWLAMGSAHVAGEMFTIADINVAFVVNVLAQRMDMGAFPATNVWLARCLARPAWQRVLAIDETALRRSLNLPVGA